MDPSSPPAYSVLLELASTDDHEAFKMAAAAKVEDVDLAGLWFCRTIGSTEMAVHHRTPLMVAAAYGSTDVLRVIIAISTAPIDRRCGPDGATALHCAASGGAPNAADAVKILLSAGADPDAVDSAGRRPADVIAAAVPRDMVLARLLGKNEDLPLVLPIISTSPPVTTDSPPLSSSPSTDSTPSPTTTVKKKEYPVDPSLPDIKNMVYATDEFRMYSFKVRPCSRAYSHDWTECPFVHPGENARRRDPRKFNYSCVPCPDFRKGACLRGDNCDYAHGVFESWLHPAQYRTKLCKDGTGCDRRVCFFAHTDNEIRTVFIPNASAAAIAHSPRSARSLEMALTGLLPPSPSSSAAAGSGLSPSPFAPPLPMSPGGGGGGGGGGGSLCCNNNHMLGWPQQPNVPMLHLPTNNHQSSRLRSALNARDVLIDDFSSMLDLDACFSPSRAPRVVSPFSGNGFYPVRTKTLPPTNLDGLFSAEISSSPRYNNAAIDQGALFSPSHKAALLNQFHHHHQQQQALLSPINTGLFSPRAVDAQQHASLLQASFGMQSPGRMSPRSYDQLAVFAQREKLQQFRSLSSRDLNVPAAQGFPVSPSMSKWGSPTGKLDWGVNNEELDLLKGAGIPLDLVSGGDDVVSPWSRTVVRKTEMEEGLKINAPVSAGGGRTVSSGSDVHSNPKPQMEGHDVLDAWLEELDN